MKTAIALLAFVALVGQALSMRVRRQVDDSEGATFDPFELKTQILNNKLWYMLQGIQALGLQGQDVTKLANKATGMCGAITALGGDIREDNLLLLAGLSDVFTEEQLQKCGAV